MAKKRFEFMLYRLNVIHSLFSQGGAAKHIKSDADIEKVLFAAQNHRFDRGQETRKNKYFWSIREFKKFTNQADLGDVLIVTLSRSILEQAGLTVTRDGLKEDITGLTPPPAIPIRIFFIMKRHLVAVEQNSSITNSSSWLDMLTRILQYVALDLAYDSHLRFEPIPRDEEIIKIFQSFRRLTRLRVNLRLPNPDLIPLFKELYEDLISNGIREYLQDMKNPGGINQAEDKRAFATAAMAQGGYKDGEILMEGFRDGKYESITTGHEAAHGRLDYKKETMIDALSSIDSPLAVSVLQKLVKEVARLAPKGKTL